MKILVATLERRQERRFGIGRALERLIPFWQAQGAEVFLLTQEETGERSQRWLAKLFRMGCWWRRRFGSNLLLLLAALAQRLNLGRLAAKVAARRGFDVVHMQDPFAALGFWLCHPRRRPRLGVTYHAFGSYAFNGTYFEELVARGWQLRWLRRLERWTLRRCDFVIVPTQAGRKQLARDLGEWPIPNHWWVIPHPKPVIPPISKEEARRHLNLPQDRSVILAVGQGKVKRLDHLLRSFALMSCRDALFVVVGPGEDPKLRRLARELGLQSRLVLNVAEDMAPYYRAADLYVSCSEIEAFGLAHLEALAAGLPVLATNVGGVPEVLGPTAMLLPPESSEKLLAQTLDLLLQDGLLREQLCRKARPWLKGWPTAPEVASGYLKVFQGVGQDLLPRPALDLLEQKHNVALSETDDPNRLKVSGRGVLHREPWTLKLAPPDWLKPLPTAPWRTVLCFAPHPDDETLGMGGTLAQLVEEGKAVHVVLVTGGQAGDPYRLSRNVVEERLQAWRKALAILGVTRSEYWQEEDSQLSWERWPKLRERARQLLQRVRPEALFVPPLYDYHRDHLFTALAVLEAWRELGAPGECYFYEVGQPHLPTHFSEISSQLEKKQRALAQYRLEQNYLDLHALSQALTTFRTKSLASSCQAIETFMHVDPRQLEALIASMLTLRRLQEGGKPSSGL